MTVCGMQWQLRLPGVWLRSRQSHRGSVKTRTSQSGGLGLVHRDKS
jgi:hypothetical protein